MIRGRASDERTLTMLKMRSNGWRDSLIADALGTTAGTVCVTISRIKSADIRESGETEKHVADAYRLGSADYQAPTGGGKKGFGW